MGCVSDLIADDVRRALEQVTTTPLAVTLRRTPRGFTVHADYVPPDPRQRDLFDVRDRAPG